MVHKKLEGVAVLALVADGVDEREFAGPLRRLKREGARVTVASLRRGTVRQTRAATATGRVRATATVFDAALEHVDALFLPGGIWSADQLRQSARVRACIRSFDEARKPIAFCGHAAAILISADVVPGRVLTSCAGVADDVRNAGGQWLDHPVVRDANWVSSRGADDVLAFNEALVELFHTRAARSLPPRHPWPRVVAGVFALAGAVAGVRRIVR